MKKLLIFFFVYASLHNVAGQSTCIEIKDKEHLPEEVYKDLKDYKAILIGEWHGTNEAPEYAEAMVNLWLNNGKKVILGLELDGCEQGRIDSFLLTGDFSIIKKSPFFNGKYRDGRSSVAMGNLIKFCYGKPNLKLVCLDITDYKKAHNKDSMMAICESNALKDNPYYTMISLTGNIHSKLDSNQFGKPIGYWLYKMPTPILTRKEIASIDIAFDSGSAWCCQPGCGIHAELRYPSRITNECSYDDFFRIYEKGTMILFTKRITASLPLNP